MSQLADQRPEISVDEAKAQIERLLGHSVDGLSDETLEAALSRLVDELRDRLEQLGQKHPSLG